ncbi:dynein regulatory complex protein 9 isoform X3 [Falco rusticolus]|uniref:dynein regulatory complex protein 9 isoform X3 n=1 Tax=Falco rusticolus TaxID=120794 RepID=UPI00188699BA|nr:dynein regulatory complex protein 9 isoform X3 [Falco rusticolus]XP_055579635.1 dynein regulatory complex protein 9 isoform X3 [Falco cherrug]
MAAKGSPAALPSGIWAGRTPAGAPAPPERAKPRRPRRVGYIAPSAVPRPLPRAPSLPRAAIRAGAAPAPPCRHPHGQPREAPGAWGSSWRRAPPPPRPARTQRLKKWKNSLIWKLCCLLLCWRIVWINSQFLDISCQFHMRARQTSATEEEGKEEIKSLKKQLQDVKEQTEIELQNRDSVILYLKDELQEMKAKMNMESCYVKKSTDLQVHQTQKKCSNAENALDMEIQKLRSKTEEEMRVHMEIENFLRQHYKKVEEELEYWMDKYEHSIDAKDEELNALKASKANNLEMLQRIAKECQTFEETIISDRAEKEAKRRQLEQDALELKSILKLQAWWRATMVRRSLGPYQALRKMREKQLSKQKEKGKKGKSGEKKKMR